MRQFQKIPHELKGVVESHRAGETLRPPPSLPSFVIDGRKVHYACAGLDKNPANTPVVLLHGFGGFFMDWPRVMAPISRHTRVYALDLPGWGFSEPNPNAKGLENDVEVLQKFLEHLNLKNVLVCGISYGAGVAWAAAAMNIPRVSRAVLLNPMPPHPLKYLQSMIYRGIFFINSLGRFSSFAHKFMDKTQYKIVCRENLLNDRLLDSFYLDLAYMVMKQPKIPYILGLHADGAKTVDWNDWEHRLAGTRIPVSILQGEQDRIFSMQSARYVHRLIPTSELITIQECGHAMVFDQHKKVSEFILRHVERQDAHEHTEEAFENVRRQKRG